MSEHEADATQADAEAQSQADTQTSDSQAEQQETISLEEAKKLRSEAAGLRKRIKDAESKAQAAADAGKTDEERRASELKSLSDRAEAAERKLQDANARVAITEAATKANAISIRAVIALIKGDLEYDDDGEPTNVSELIAKAKKDEPSLFKAAAGSSDAGKGNGSDTPQNINAALRAALGRK